MATQVGVDLEEIRKDLEATTEEKIVNVTEKNLWNQLIDYQKEKIRMIILYLLLINIKKRIRSLTI